MNKLSKSDNNNLFKEIKDLITQSRKKVIKTVNSEMVLTYFQIGRLIVESEQKGEERAEYGKETLKDLSRSLSAEFGKGFSVDNLENMRKFYLVYGKSETVSRKFLKPVLSWSHYVLLMQYKDLKRGFYEKEAIQNQWSLRELKRQVNSALFERIALSKNKKGVLADNLNPFRGSMPCKFVSFGLLPTDE